MAESPAVSVIIPSFNRAATLPRAIDSVLKQSFDDLELIVVDDASTDGTEAVVQQFHDDRVRYLRHSKNRFAAAARNTGMQAARGEYIAFLDSDDEWLNHKLECQVDSLQSCDASWGCCYGGANVIDVRTHRRRVYRPTHSGNVLNSYLMSRFIVWTPTFLFRRACLDEIGMMDESLIRCQDRDFFVRFFDRYQTTVVSEPLVNVYSDSLSRNVVDARRGRLAFLEKHENRIEELGPFWSRYVHALQWCLQAEQEFSIGRFSQGFAAAFHCLRWNPCLPPKRYAALVLRAAQGCFSRAGRNQVASVE